MRTDLHLPSKDSSDPALQAGRIPVAESLSSLQRSRHVVLAQMQWPQGGLDGLSSDWRRPTSALPLLKPSVLKAK